MPVVALLLLGAGVAGAVGHVRRPALAAVPAVLAAAAVAVGAVEPAAAGDALRLLVEPLLFLLLAVPLAVLLAEAGVFDAVARRLPVRWVAPGLWTVGAVTVALVNLDAAVVLLTPVAVHGARRAGEDARGLALQPALLACLSSSWLPVSNLTNLVAEEHHRRGAAAFLRHLGPPSLAAVAVGYVLWRTWWRRPAAPAEHPVRSASGDVAAVRIGGAVAVVLLAGFTLGGTVGVPPWGVAALVVAGLVARTRRVPLDAVPWRSAAVVGGLAVLAVAAAAQVDIGGLLGDGRGAAGAARITATGAAAANLANNLPALVAGLPHLPATPVARWAWLLGVNAGPTVVVTGSLSGLLWLDVARRSGLDVGWRDYASAGLRVGLPALAAATAVLTVTA